MKIMYVCTGNTFTEDMSYKENYMLKAHQEMGCDIFVIADTTKYVDNQIVNVSEGMYTVYGNIPLKRIRYRNYFCSKISMKIRNYANLLDDIFTFKPDVIYFNCLQVYNINDLRKIKEVLTNVKIYTYVTSAYYNSGMTFLSMNILHKRIYRKWINKNFSFFDKIYYVSPESKEFLLKVYKIKDDNLEYCPLPCEIVSVEQKEKFRKEYDEKYNLTKDCVVFSHTGKFDKRKLTLELIYLFTKNKNKNYRLFLGGKFDKEIEKESLEMIKEDKRIVFLDFLSHDDLIKLLCATDMYLQPGTPSQTAQTAIGCGCPIVVAKIPVYYDLVVDNGFIIDDITKINDIFEKIESREIDLNKMSENSYCIAIKELSNKKNILKFI